MEKVEIVVDDGMLFVRWDDGTLSPIKVEVYDNPYYGLLIVDEVKDD